MSLLRLGLVTSAISALFASAALAGAPLKGVDVKLGRNPGGMAAARTTDGDGRADFGVLPAGQYTVSVASRKTAHLIVSGSPGGSVELTLAPLHAQARAARSAPTVVEVSGREPVVVTVTEP